MMIKKTIILMLTIAVVFTGCIRNEGSLIETDSSSPIPVVTEKNKPVINAKAYENINDEIKMNVTMSIPSITGLVNQEAQDSINNVLSQFANERKDSFEQEAKEDADAVAEEMEPYPHTLDGGFEVKTIDEKILSISIFFNTYTGGAHGMTNIFSYTFSLNDGHIIKLKDLFEESFDYISAINEDIRNRNYTFTGAFGEYDIEVENFSGVDDNTKYYIKEGKLVIYYNVYEIAAYAAGTLEFIVSDSILFDYE